MGLGLAVLACGLSARWDKSQIHHSETQLTKNIFRLLCSHRNKNINFLKKIVFLKLFYNSGFGSKSMYLFGFTTLVSRIPVPRGVKFLKSWSRIRLTASLNLDPDPGLCNRVECGRPFLSGQNRSTNQRSEMILEAQNRRFSARAHRRMRSKLFIFKKFQGLKIFFFFCGNEQNASFYLTEEDSPRRKF